MFSCKDGMDTGRALPIAAMLLLWAACARASSDRFGALGLGELDRAAGMHRPPDAQVDLYLPFLLLAAGSVRARYL